MTTFNNNDICLVQEGTPKMKDKDNVVLGDQQYVVVVSEYKD